MADKNRIYEDLKDMVEEEIDKIVKKGDLDEKQLMYLDKLIDISKDICEIEEKNEMSENGYSQRMYPPMYYRDNDLMTGNVADMGNSYRRRRDSMGRYSRDMYDDRMMSRDGYSGHGNNDMADRLGRMMSEATTDREREAIRSALERI